MVQIINHHFEGYHRVAVATCDKSDLRAVIAVHNINLGPALGGCRVLEYNSLDDQMADAMKLAKGMTYKSALAGNKLGGGKATIQGPLTDEKLKAFGEAMNAINIEYPMYYTAADVGTNNDVLAKVAKVSDFVNYKGQDCSIATAHGVYYAMQGALEYLGRDMNTEVVSLLGYGKVGKRLAKICIDNGAHVIVSDVVDPFKNRSSYGACHDLIPGKLGYTDYRTAHWKGTTFAPCALGGIINERSIGDIPGSQLICGAANNQLASPIMEAKMLAKDITYVPDYLANAGGVIITAEQNGEFVDLDWSDDKVLPRLKAIAETTKTVLRRAEEENLTTVAVANKMAEEIFNG